MSARKRERRPLLQAHVDRVRTVVWHLMHATGYMEGNAPRRLTQRERRVLDALIRETRALEALLRPITRSDRAWLDYDKDVVALVRYLDPNGYTSDGYATGKLHQALDMIGGAASRAPRDERPWPPGVSELATAASRRPRSRETADARHVLNDLLEERGYSNVAKLVRLNDRGVDRFLLPYLRGEFYAAAPSTRRRDFQLERRRRP